MKLNQVPRLLIVVLCTLVGLYPITYYVLDLQHLGFLHNKPASLLHNRLWYTLFYVHITCGGIALLSGWPQFSNTWRNRALGFHRFLGKIYLLAVLGSGLSGFYIAWYADGGIVASTGFATLATLWIASAFMSYTTIRQGHVNAHRHWITVNYALTFAAVSLRIMLPVSTGPLHIPFMTAYPAIAWLCWVPNLFVAWLITRRQTEENLVLPPSYLGEHAEAYL